MNTGCLASKYKRAAWCCEYCLTTTRAAGIRDLSWSWLPVVLCWWRTILTWRREYRCCKMATRLRSTVNSKPTIAAVLCTGPIATRKDATHMAGWNIKVDVMSNHKLVGLATAAAVLPFVTFNTTYLIASSLGHVPECFTYLEGCTSVSSTGRQLPETVLFKAGVLTLALVLAVHWHRAANYLQPLGLSSGGARALRSIAYVSSIALSIYAITLGLPDQQFGTLRRIGTHGFAFSSWILQITFVVLYRPCRTAATEATWRWLAVICSALLLVGLASELAKLSGMPRKTTNNIAAWNAFLVLTAFYAVLARHWWHHQMSSGRRASPNE